MENVRADVENLAAELERCKREIAACAGCGCVGETIGWLDWQAEAIMITDRRKAELLDWLLGEDEMSFSMRFAVYRDEWGGEDSFMDYAMDRMRREKAAKEGK